jgi:hypothetical protein
VCWILEIQEMLEIRYCVLDIGNSGNISFYFFMLDIRYWMLGVEYSKKNIQCKILNNQYPNVKSAFVSLCWLFDIVYWLLEIQEMLEIRYCVLDIGNSGNSQCKILNYQYPGAVQMAPCSSLKNRKLNNNTNLKKE